LISYDARMVAWTLTGRESMLGILARMLRRNWRRAAPILLVALRLVLVVAGLGLLTAAAWTWALSAGLAAAGLSCLVFEWVVKRR
jgi:hypothetical protein